MLSKAHSFNHYIGNWDVSNVIHMSSMLFEASSYNQDISNWNVTALQMKDEVYRHSIVSQISIEFYTNLLIKWSKLDLQDSVKIHFPSEFYPEALEALRTIIVDHHWDITDKGMVRDSTQINIFD